MPLDVRFSNIVIDGVPTSTPPKNGAYLSGQGLLIHDADGASFTNVHLSNFSTGVEIADSAKRTTFNNLTIDSVSKTGIYMSASITSPDGVDINGCIIRDFDREGAKNDYAAGIYIGAAFGVRVRNCEFDATSNELPRYGIRIVDYGIDTAPLLEGNIVRRLDASGTAFSVKSDRQAFPWTARSNTAAQGILLYDGPPPTP